MQVSSVMSVAMALKLWSHPADWLPMAQTFTLSFSRNLWQRSLCLFPGVRVGKVVQTWLEVNPTELFPISFAFSPFHLVSRFHGLGTSEMFNLQTLLLLFDMIVYPVKLKLCIVTYAELLCVWLWWVFSLFERGGVDLVWFFFLNPKTLQFDRIFDRLLWCLLIFFFLNDMLAWTSQLHCNMTVKVFLFWFLSSSQIEFKVWHDCALHIIKGDGLAQEEPYWHYLRCFICL